MGGPRRSSPLTWRLVAFALASALVLDLALGLLGQATALGETVRWLRGHQLADSWRPMNLAYTYLSGAPREPLYDWLFFGRHVKFIYPPTSLLLVDGLDALLPRRAWGAALNALSWALVALAASCSVALLDRGLQRVRPAPAPERALRALAAGLLALTFYPLVKAYTLGQAQVIVNAALAALVLCWVSGRKATGGALLALACAVKPQYGALVLWGALRREWRFVAVAVAVGLALLAVSVARFGLEHHLDYLRVLATVARTGEAFHANQSVNGILNRWLGLGGVGANLAWDPHRYPPYHPLVRWGTLVSSALLLGVALWPPRGPERGRALDLCTAALALTMASPIAWEHTYAVLLPVFAIALPALLERPVLGRATLPAAGAAWVVAARPWEVASRLAAGPWNLLESSLFAAAAGVLGLLLALRARRARPSRQ